VVVGDPGSWKRGPFLPCCTSLHPLSPALQLPRPCACPLLVPPTGDLGGYKFKPGSRECFVRGREYLAGFGLPTTLVTGNHE